jgi:hypothetical protein
MILNGKNFLLCFLVTVTTVNSFSIDSRAIIPVRVPSFQSETTHSNNSASALKMAGEIDVEFEEEEEAEVGSMRVSEIKSELNLRAVDYSDCFDKESLALKLREARATGKADPTIIDQFNSQTLENNMNDNKVELDDDLLDKIKGGDGTLPGGMPPEMLQNLMANPELMTLMQNPKMQDVMKLMMTGGSEALEKAMEEDREVYEIVSKLNTVMGNAM